MKGSIRRAGMKTGARAPAGTPPGTLTAKPDAHPTTIRYIRYGQNDIVEGECTADNPIPPEGPGDVAWLNVDGLGDPDVLHRIGEKYGLHPLALEDVMNVPQRAKADEYDGQYFIVIHMPKSPESTATEQVSLFLGEDYVVSFQERPGDCLESVRKRLRQGRTRIRSLGPGYLAYAIIDAIIDSYYPVLEAQGERLEQLEHRILTDSTSVDATEIYGAKGDLLALRRIVWPMREALATILRLESSIIPPKVQVYYRDCLDHANQLLDLVETYRDLGSGLMDLYLSQVSHRMNEVMKVLTIIATIFIPTTFVAGIYGMNFDGGRSPWNMPELSWYFGYPLALLLMAAIAIVMLAYFRRKRWLGS